MKKPPLNLQDERFLLRLSVVPCGRLQFVVRQFPSGRVILQLNALRPGSNPKCQRFSV